MKSIKILLAGLVVASSFVVLNADKIMQMFQSVNPQKATLVQKGDEKKFCPVCGMNLPMFYKTNHAAHVHGKEKQYCSIHCLVEDRELNHADVQDIQVVDVTSLKFINAKDAYYVVGSKKKGTMSMVSKYAFKNLEDAAKFAKENGGIVMDFNAAYSEAKKDFKNDARMIAKKQKMMAQKGEMMYNKMCQSTDKKFDSIAAAKAYVQTHSLCGELNPKQLQAIGLYLYNR
jgi:nitrous oxide reductase accessory protein NosL